MGLNSTKPTIITASWALLFVVVAFIVSADRSQATVFYSTSLENQTCNSTPGDGVNLDGKPWDYYDPPYPAIRCALTPPAGSKYVEWNDTVSDLNNNQNDVYNLTVQPISGTTYYLAGYFRFERVGGADIWIDTPNEARQVTCNRGVGDPADSFDKLFEIAGIGIRWGISSGWPGGNYPGAHDHKFTFDAWCASSVVNQCELEGTYDHKVSNANGYTANNPYLADYDTWYSLVLGVTAGTTSGTGRVQLWVNGAKIIDLAHTTMNPTAQITRITTNGTLAQPCYDSPAHKRQIDRMLLTDTWQDVLDGGYMSWSGSGSDTTPPSAPMGLGVQ